MKKATKSLLILTLIMGLVMFSPVYGVTSAAPEGEVHKVSFEELKNSVSANSKILNSYEQILDKEGNTLVIYGAPIDRDFVFEHLLKDKKVPYLFGEGELKKENTHKTKITPSVKTKTTFKKGSDNKLDFANPLSKNKLTSYTTKMIIYNYQGDLFVEFESHHLPKNTPLSKVINQEKIEKETMSAKTDQQILKLQRDVQEARKKHPRGVAKKVNVDGITASATWLTRLRDGSSVYGTNPETLEVSLVGQYLVDYNIYNANDQDSRWDHIIIHAHAQHKPVDVVNPLLNGHTGGVQGAIYKRYLEDELVEWAPSTTSLKRDKGQSVGSFTIGYPGSITFSFSWGGEDDVELVTAADKTSDQGYYLNLWRHSWGQGWPVATTTFHNDYAVMLGIDTIDGTYTWVEAYCEQSYATFFYDAFDSNWGTVGYDLYYNY